MRFTTVWPILKQIYPLSHSRRFHAIELSKVTRILGGRIPGTRLEDLDFDPDRSYDKLMRELKKTDLLLLDDWGMAVHDPASGRDLLECQRRNKNDENAG